jgi:hypothetical protein
MHGVPSASALPSVRIHISGKLFHGHIAYLDCLIQSAADCELWVVLDLEQLIEVDRAALFFLMDGENSKFGIVSCPNLIREWMEHESTLRVA